MLWGFCFGLFFCLVCCVVWVFFPFFFFSFSLYYFFLESGNLSKALDLLCYFCTKVGEKIKVCLIRLQSFPDSSFIVFFLSESLNTQSHLAASEKLTGKGVLLVLKVCSIIYHCVFVCGSGV